MDEELQERNSRVGKPPRMKGENKLEQGGYTAMLHAIERQCYGPDSPFDAKTKVFFYIRHETVRDWKYVQSISQKEISEATGVKIRDLHRVLDFLEKNKMIISHKSKTGRVWNKTQYALHPARFGIDTLWRGEGNQIEKANKNQTSFVSEEGKIIPITRKKVPTNSRGMDTDKEQVPPTCTGQAPNELNFSQLMEKIASKNPFKEAKAKEPSSERGKSFTQALGKEERELQKRWLIETNGEISFPEWKKAQ